MKKALSGLLMMSLMAGFFSCENQGGKQEDKKRSTHKQYERSHPRRSNMVSQQPIPSSPNQQVNQ